MNYILIFKALHIIGFMVWFAGLFFYLKLMVFQSKEKSNHIFNVGVFAYKKIANPAMMITWTFGLMLLFFHGMEFFKHNAWIHPKLLLIVVITVLHVLGKGAIKKIQTGEPVNYSRLNLYATIQLVLFALVIILAVLRPF